MNAQLAEFTRLKMYAFWKRTILCFGLFWVCSTTAGQTTPIVEEKFFAPPRPSKTAQASEAKLKRAIAENPEIASTWTDLGWRLYKNGKYAECETVMAEARSRSPDDPYVLWLSGLACFAMGHYPQAKEHLWHLFKDFKTYPETVDRGTLFDVLGRINLEDGKLFEASYFLSKAGDESRDNWQVYLLLGYCEIQRARVHPLRYSDALAALTKARSLNPRHPLVLKFYAFVVTALDVNWPSPDDPRFEKAYMVIRAAISAAPREPDNHTLLAQLYLARGDIPQAIESARRATAVDESDAFSGYILAKVLLSRNMPQDREEARQLLMRAIAIQPDMLEGTQEAPHAGLLITTLLEDGQVEQAHAVSEWMSREAPEGL